MARDLTQSQEDYLEAIYVMASDERGARSRDISSALGVRRPSVTTALKSLAEKGLVNYAPYDRVSLTPGGKRAARNVAERHRIIRKFLTSVLGVSATDAETEACRLEHGFSAPVFARFVEFVGALDRCPERAVRWDPSRGFGCPELACDGCAPPEG